MKRFLECAECSKRSKIVREVKTHGIVQLELSCGHKIVDLERSVNVEILCEPLVMSEEALNRGDYFSSITSASAMLEGYGKQLLAKEFIKRKLEVGNKTIGNLSLHTIIIMLYAMQLINTQEFRTLMMMKRYRNEFVHKGKAMVLPSKFVAKVEPITKETHTCLRKIMKKLGGYRVR